MKTQTPSMPIDLPLPRPRRTHQLRRVEANKGMEECYPRRMIRSLLSYRPPRVTIHRREEVAQLDMAEVEDELRVEEVGGFDSASACPG